LQTDLSPRAGIGPALRRAREARGVSLEAASRSTRIRPRYLAALEDDAGSDAFPGPVYARFFLKEYARFLGVDDAPLVHALEERSAPAPPPLRLVAELEPPRRWVGRLVRAAAVIALVGLVGYAVVGSGPHAAPGNGTTESARARLLRLPAYEPRPHAFRAPPRVDRVAIRAGVVFLASTEAVVLVNGSRALDGTVEPGRMVFRARDAHRRAPSVEVRVADGSAIRLRVNGRPVPTAGRTPFRARFESSAGRTVRT
jgi:cytoskeleton protein RodZ